MWSSASITSAKKDHSNIPITVGIIGVLNNLANNAKIGSSLKILLVRYIIVQFILINLFYCILFFKIYDVWFYTLENPCLGYPCTEASDLCFHDGPNQHKCSSKRKYSIRRDEIYLLTTLAINFFFFKNEN